MGLELISPFYRWENWGTEGVYSLTQGHTTCRIWLRTQISESDSWWPQILSAVRAQGLAWQWMPAPPSQPETLPHCQMSLAALETQNDNGVGGASPSLSLSFLRKREREGSRGWEKNYSHHKFPSGPLPRFEDSGMAGKIWSRREERVQWGWGSRTGCLNSSVRPAPKDKLHGFEAHTKWKCRAPQAKMMKNFKRVPVKHKIKCGALLRAGSYVAAEWALDTTPSCKWRPSTTQQVCKEG